MLHMLSTLRAHLKGNLMEKEDIRSIFQTVQGKWGHTTTLVEPRLKFSIKAIIELAVGATEAHTNVPVKV